MRFIIARVVPTVILVLVGLASAVRADPGEKRIALVVGNAVYQTGALPTAANDAGLIAQTLQAAGFDVIGARDLDQDALRRTFRDFLEKATRAGAGTVAFVYLSGYALQLEGENYFIPVDAKIGRDSDIAAEAVRVSDYIRPLGALDLKASVIVLDAARKNPFTISGAPLAGGLALVEPSRNMIVAFNAAPGTAAPEQSGPYGPYAQALAEMMREGGLSPRGVFERTRLRVNDATKGAQVPWNSATGDANSEPSFVFFERAADAPALSAEQTAAVHERAIGDLGAPDAYHAVLERDTLEVYEQFLVAYPEDPMAKRVRAIVAARRESITWRQSNDTNTAEAYWSYLGRYPDGPHAADARRRLANRAFAADPPASYTPIDYRVPPPPPEEVVFVRRPVLVFDDPYFDFAPPPPLAFYFLPPPPPYWVVLLAPPPPFGLFLLPVPVFVPIPVWCHHPAYLVPARNVFFNNIHNTVIVNNVTNRVIVKNANGQVISSKPASPSAGRPLGAPLPPSLAKAALAQPRGGAGTTAAIPGQQSGKLPRGQPLPGVSGNGSPPKSAGIAPPAKAIAAPAKLQPPPRAPQLVNRAAPYRPPAAAPARAFSPPAAAARPAVAARPAPAAAAVRKPPGH